ncbi:succinyl-CoA:acetate CoA-transferase [Herbaspirillum sp. Sphag1AN]|uniref:acetyl-CoA hydrolase/transferase family protein n=1 Tax=unclassified Herbaspirillum TaxID=2624150 RepID=UPI0016084A23|nr:MULTISPECIES: acetyl-CoA hydrolase/transferase family protein [unclassified Herbaspirillum]MBB3214051.1 succinyl-CoA:acetate CoA-transferase [Herbaspirillum sp. Sphag1AN]MBB3247556.1 succinyl-CoA:acetate CoA-transferase [Herbaspirillum sp. Sphag64]
MERHPQQSVLSRIPPALADRVMSAEQAANLFRHGMTVGLSGFTRAGDAKALPQALAERATAIKGTTGEPFQLTVITGASLGNGSDALMAQAGLLARRLPFQVDNVLRKKINAGEVMFIDQHLSETVEQLRSQCPAAIDIAVIEAAAITEEGIIPTMSVGNSASFVEQARQVIIELNTSVPLELCGLHDVYLPEVRPARQPIALTRPDQRIGSSTIAIDPRRIVAIVATNKPDSPSTILPADAETDAIATHVIAFLEGEVRAGRLPTNLAPLQAGIGTIANAVLHGLIDSSFRDLTMYSEVLQDSAIELLDSGQLAFASASSITLSEAMNAHFLRNIERYRSRLVLRPQEISNHPELVRRLGIIALNTALEFDIYGNVNSTHVGGTHMMNGIGGSGDFARNAQISIFVTKATAKDGDISSVVPMVSHVDHTEHDVDVLVTEFGLADLRGLAPRERAPLIIEHCVHPDYRPALRDYFARACTQGGHTPHVMAEALSWHVNYSVTKRMRVA